MTWQPEADEIRKRRLAALAMGGADRVTRQHEQGKKTARERLDLLLDAGSFTELGLFATHQSQRPEMQGVRTAADGFIMGYGRVDGREVLVGARGLHGHGRFGRHYRAAQARPHGPSMSSRARPKRPCWAPVSRW